MRKVYKCPKCGEEYDEAYLDQHQSKNFDWQDTGHLVWMCNECEVMLKVRVAMIASFWDIELASKEDY